MRSEIKTKVSENKSAVQEQKNKEEQPTGQTEGKKKTVVAETPKKVVTLYSNTTLNVRSGAGTSYSF